PLIVELVRIWLVTALRPLIYIAGHLPHAIGTPIAGKCAYSTGGPDSGRLVIAPAGYVLVLFCLITPGKAALFAGVAGRRYVRRREPRRRRAHDGLLWHD